ncbi:helix-turn-helix transcriptional regulator [Ectobacillus sp. JY-23]|uniref:winged helix-turn-helix transcriptional regulator n=1 Tax=Ectobacillus sp. JY-23 TaxID=2933872 RepID=UPI001FF51560|nr:helix-turn-helix domain-containing protein [Ectobacillus sp. JY-23]UOY91086.1 helix-turn-helix transcriptional regulator [Ectobacillus sp. JY-23]
MEHNPALCPKFESAFTLLSKKWTGLIIQSLLGEPMRFREIAEIIPNMSDRMLSERLKELESEGIVVRTVYPEVPVRIEYTLTAKGRALENVMGEVQKWAERWV